MSEDKLQTRTSSPLKERGQYLLAFGVVASMLWVANFPIFVIFFFGVFAYFLLRMFAAGSRSETREIFEFYLTANEILRDDDRRWYGFEINEAIARGEEVLRRMNGSAPPLVHFALGALQNKAGNHKAAIANLAYITENTGSNEAAYSHPTPELRNYVKVLRKIEREPADAPLTSAAVRALERARKIRANAILEDSRQKFSAIPAQTTQENTQQLEAGVERNGYAYEGSDTANGVRPAPSVTDTQPVANRPNGLRGLKKRKAEKSDRFSDRKPISEVLHDIYDKNVQ